MRPAVRGLMVSNSLCGARSSILSIRSGVVTPGGLGVGAIGSVASPCSLTGPVGLPCSRFTLPTGLGGTLGVSCSLPQVATLPLLCGPLVSVLFSNSPPLGRALRPAPLSSLLPFLPWVYCPSLFCTLPPRLDCWALPCLPPGPFIGTFLPHWGLPLP